MWGGTYFVPFSAGAPCSPSSPAAASPSSAAPSASSPAAASAGKSSGSSSVGTSSVSSARTVFAGARGTLASGWEMGTLPSGRDMADSTFIFDRSSILKEEMSPL